jgi:methanogenic corrinoid protein MtbC1
MEERKQKLRNILSEFSDTWRQNPTISWSEIYQIGEKLLERKTEEKIPGLWEPKPTMITATLEDGVGQGLKMIRLFSVIAGIEIVPLGLMQTEEVIIEACTKQQPDFLGMTILQFDSEERLNHIIDHIPKEIQVVVGGPAFKLIDKEELLKKNYIVLNTVGAYLNYLLHWQPDKEYRLFKP